MQNRIASLNEPKRTLSGIFESKFSKDLKDFLAILSEGKKNLGELMMVLEEKGAKYKDTAQRYLFAKSLLNTLAIILSHYNKESKEMGLYFDRFNGWLPYAFQNEIAEANQKEFPFLNTPITLNPIWIENIKAFLLDSIKEKYDPILLEELNQKEKNEIEIVETMLSTATEELEVAEAAEKAYSDELEASQFNQSESTQESDQESDQELEEDMRPAIVLPTIDTNVFSSKYGFISSSANLLLFSSVQREKYNQQQTKQHDKLAYLDLAVSMKSR